MKSGDCNSLVVVSSPPVIIVISVALVVVTISVAISVTISLAVVSTLTVAVVVATLTVAIHIESRWWWSLWYDITINCLNLFSDRDLCARQAGQIDHHKRILQRGLTQILDCLSCNDRLGAELRCETSSHCQVALHFALIHSLNVLLDSAEQAQELLQTEGETINGIDGCFLLRLHELRDAGLLGSTGLDLQWHFVELQQVLCNQSTDIDEGLHAQVLVVEGGIDEDVHGAWQKCCWVELRVRCAVVRVDEGRCRNDLSASCEPSDYLISWRDLLVKSKHLFVILLIHENAFAFRVFVHHGEAVGDVNGAAFANATKKSSDCAVGTLWSPHICTQNLQNGHRMHTACKWLLNACSQSNVEAFGRVHIGFLGTHAPHWLAGLEHVVLRCERHL